MESVATESPLPPGFEDLVPLLPEWNLPSEQQRYEHRLSLPLAKLRTFYDTILPRMDQILGYLQTNPMDDSTPLRPATQNLFHLALGYFEASHAIELKWRGTDLKDAFPAARIIYREPSKAP